MDCYLERYVPEHPRAGFTGFVGEHILAMEQKLGRYLERGEVVHHCDFDKSNNEINNLLLLSRQEHQQLPAFQARFIIQQGLYEAFLTYWRQCKDTPDPIRELNQQLLQATNMQRRLAVRLEKQNAKDCNK